MRALSVLLFVSISAFGLAPPQNQQSYDESLVLTPLYIEYATVSDDKFAEEARALRERIGGGRHVMLGFAAFLTPDYSAAPDLDSPIDASLLSSSLAEIDTIVERARRNGIVAHIAVVSGLFHGWNRLRESAIRRDVRNAQWFADGWIAPPADLTDRRRIPRSVWITVSKHATALHQRMEESTRVVARHIARRMAEFPETLVTVSGDGEVELSFERTLGPGGTATGNTEVFYTDYSPFAVAEFRDWLRTGAYAGDSTPSTDDNGDGRTFNRDYGQVFQSWRLRYFDESGPIPYAMYVGMADKLPASGPNFIGGGFDAPREPNAGDRFWEAWTAFRTRMITAYVRSFAEWMTTSGTPAERFYSHQIPGDFLFGKKDNVRLHSSASPLSTAFIAPFGSAGVTAYNVFDSKRHLKTASDDLFRELARRSRNWGLLEFNPSMPARDGISPATDVNYYLSELRRVYKFRPHIIVPFPWTELEPHSQAAIQGRPFERALRQFRREIGDKPWAPVRR